MNCQYSTCSDVATKFSLVKDSPRKLEVLAMCSYHFNRISVLFIPKNAREITEEEYSVYKVLEI